MAAVIRRPKKSLRNKIGSWHVAHAYNCSSWEAKIKRSAV
jgi:hypothetical protein